MATRRPENGNNMNKAKGFNAGKKPSDKRRREPSVSDKKTGPSNVKKQVKPVPEKAKTSDVDEYLEERLSGTNPKKEEQVKEKKPENIISDALIYEDEKPVFKLRDPSWSSNIPLVLFLFAIVVYGLIVL